jgi:tryptophan-rich sensory protein
LESVKRIAFCILLFRRIQPLAGYLLFPYLAWVTFAAALNVAIFVLN